MRPFTVNMAKREAQSLVARKTPAIETSANLPARAETWDRLLVLDREPGKFVLARWKNVFVQAWAAQADAAAMARVNNIVRGANGQRLGVRSSISVVAEGLPPPTEEARAGFVALMNDNANEIVCLAIVVQGVGFASSALRSALTGMRLAAGQSSYEMSVFATVDEISPWLPLRHEAKTGVKLDPARLCDVVRRVQSAAASGGSVPASAIPPARE